MPENKNGILAQKKVLMCETCGKKLDDDSLDAQKRHKAETGHRLYRVLAQ